MDSVKNIAIEPGTDRPQGGRRGSPSTIRKRAFEGLRGTGGGELLVVMLDGPSSSLCWILQSVGTLAGVREGQGWAGMVPDKCESLLN